MSNPGPSGIRLSVQLPAANVSDLVCSSGERACGSSLTASFPGVRKRFFRTDEEELDGQVTKVHIIILTLYVNEIPVIVVLSKLTSLAKFLTNHWHCLTYLLPIQQVACFTAYQCNKN